MDGHSCLPDPGLQVTLSEGNGVLVLAAGIRGLEVASAHGQAARRGSRFQAQVIENPFARRPLKNRRDNFQLVLARRIFMGHLFIGEQLLSDSAIRNHPLTPMTDANLVRVMQAYLQAGKARKTGLISHAVVSQGSVQIAPGLAIGLPANDGLKPAPVAPRWRSIRCVLVVAPAKPGT